MPLPPELLHPAQQVPADTTLREAAMRMESRIVGALFVIDEDEQAVGIVTDRDIAHEALRHGRDPATATVGEIMSAPLVTLNESGTLADASRMMRKHFVRRLPVVDDEGALLGLLEADDLIRRIGDKLGQLSQAITRGREAEARLGETAFHAYGHE